LLTCVGITVALLRWACAAMRRRMDPSGAGVKSPAQQEGSDLRTHITPTVMSVLQSLARDTWSRLRGRGILKPALKLVWFCLPLGFFFAVYWGWLRWVRNERADALAETDRLDLGWRWEERSGQDVQIPDSENSALQILKVWPRLEAAWEREEIPYSPHSHSVPASDIKIMERRLST